MNRTYFYILLSLLFLMPSEFASAQTKDSLKVCVNKQNGSIKAKNKCKSSKENALTEKSYTQGTLYVATSGAKYTDIQTAIDDAAEDASATAPALVKIGPGKFTITDTITMADYVSLEGSGVGVTIIEVNTDTGINLAEYISLRNMTLTSTVASGVTLLQAVVLSGGVELENLKLLYNGAGNLNYGLFSSFTPIKLNNIEVDITSASGMASYGLEVSDSPNFQANNLQIRMTNGANRGMMITSGTVATVRNSTIYTSTSTGSDQTHGLYVVGTTTTVHVQGLRSESTETGSGVAGAAWLNNTGAVVIKDSYLKTVGSANGSVQVDEASVAQVHNSVIIADSGVATVATSETAAVSIASSQIAGGAVSISGGSSITCAGVYDENFTFNASSCP